MTCEIGWCIFNSIGVRVIVFRMMMQTDCYPFSHVAISRRTENCLDSNTIKEPRLKYEAGPFYCIVLYRLLVDFGNGWTIFASFGIVIRDGILHMLYKDILDYLVLTQATDSGIHFKTGVNKSGLG